MDHGGGGRVCLGCVGSAAENVSGTDTKLTRRDEEDLTAAGLWVGIVQTQLPVSGFKLLAVGLAQRDDAKHSAFSSWSSAVLPRPSDTTEHSMGLP